MFGLLGLLVVAVASIGVGVVSAAGGAGEIDNSFNAGSGVLTNSSVSAIAVQADGKILVGGNFNAYNGDVAAPDNILRLNAD